MQKPSGEQVGPQKYKKDRMQTKENNKSSEDAEVRTPLRNLLKAGVQLSKVLDVEET